MRLTPTGRALLAHIELTSFSSPCVPKPPSEEFLEQCRREDKIYDNTDGGDDEMQGYSKGVPTSHLPRSLRLGDPSTERRTLMLASSLYAQFANRLSVSPCPRPLRTMRGYEGPCSKP